MMRTVCIAVICILIAAASAHAEMLSVDRPSLNMRSGPGTNYSVLWELGRGYPLKVVARKGKWLKVVDFENDSGWVYRPLTSRRAHLIVKKSVVNIRSGPGTRYRVVGKANYGVVLRTQARRGGWVKVRHEKGLTGWVQRNLLWGW